MFPPLAHQAGQISLKIDRRLQRGIGALANWLPRREPLPVAGIWLSDEPPVLVMCDYHFNRSVKERPDFWERFRHRSLRVILLRSWELPSAAHAETWKPLIDRHLQAFPLHRITYTVNNQEDLPKMAAAGIETFWCNYNVFVDERVFCPPEGARGGESREFDALYDARFSRFKRHHLARKVPRLALIHYEAPSLCEPLWWASVRWRLRRARILNRRRCGFWPVLLEREEVAAVNRRARVGLCLSATEGTMVASIQYLLSGIPVVTTPNKGGRSVFFDSDNSIEVEPQAEAVAAGVRALIARRVDPWLIRARTIARMEEHRARLFAHVEDFQREQGIVRPGQVAKEWPARIGNVYQDKPCRE